MLVQLSLQLVSSELLKRKPNMKTLYLESVGGASGDMLLGALCALGLNFEEFKAPLEAGLPELTIKREVVKRHGLTMWRLWGDVGEHVHERHLSEIKELVLALDLPQEVKDKAIAAFQRLGEVEANAHGCSIDHIHFHELGATDSIMDIVGYFWALHLLGVERVEASPLKLGYGSVKTAHGLLPVPVPAVAALIEGIPVEVGNMEGEMTTPTGALLIGQSAQKIGQMPSMTVSAQAMGTGTKEYEALNVLRAWLGEIEEEQNSLLLFECNIDDTTPEQLSYARECLENAGALDVTILTGQGKKGRPVHLLQVLFDSQKEDELLDIVFRETTTLGVRKRPVDRVCLPRFLKRVEVEGYPVSVKVANWKEDVTKFQPEYEDCAAISRKTGYSLSEIMDKAKRAAQKGHPKD